MDAEITEKTEGKNENRFYGEFQETVVFLLFLRFLYDDYFLYCSILPSQYSRLCAVWETDRCEEYLLKLRRC